MGPVHRAGTDVVITLEVPGVDVSDIDIEVNEGRLTVNGERRDTWEDSRGKVLVREVRYGSFRRTFQLPEGVNADQIEAEVDRGLLRLRIRNVTRPVEPPRKIAIRSSQATSLTGQIGQQKTIDAKSTEVTSK